MKRGRLTLEQRREIRRQSAEEHAYWQRFGWRDVFVCAACGRDEGHAEDCPRRPEGDKHP